MTGITAKVKYCVSSVFQALSNSFAFAVKDALHSSCISSEI